ncbi:MAG: hypothetical protein GY797_29210 [Deltaproteobacteria bacterium]|nr:hypothetical protein [Deltaproteobacteria bacterium]
MDLGIMKPDLTIVATARNDNHGGNLLQRMQLFVNGLLEQCWRHQLKAELILVDWNPPPNKPLLAQALSWTAANHVCPVRIIVVPHKIHRRFNYSDQLPFFQMIAKNVGIRRAQGRFILATNVDLLFSDELMVFLASGHLHVGRMYRLNRYDVPSDVPLKAPLNTQLEYCRQNIIRINAREGTKNLQSGHYHPIYPQLTWREWLSEKMKDWGLRPVNNKSRLHTNACGDFTLMARERWFALCGYPEFEMYSLHLDSVLCHAAHYGGAREKVLSDSMQVYHIEHATGSGWTPEGQQKLNTRLSAVGIPQLDHDKFTVWATQMRQNRRPIIFNNNNWGLANESLTEIIVPGPND